MTAARHHDAAEVASDWIWEFNTNQRLTFVSKRFGDTSGIPWASVDGHPIADLVEMGFDPNGMDAILAAADARAVFQGCVNRVDLAGGQTRFWSLSGKPFYDLETGAYAGYRGTGTDVTTAIKRETELTEALLRAEAAERAAQQARRMLVDAIEAIPEGFVLHDAEDRLVLCNARYGEIYGLSPELMMPGVLFEDSLRATNKRHAYVSGAKDTEAWIAERMQKHRAVDGSHIQQQLPNGCWLQVEERRTSDGGIVGIRVDVTDVRRREALERDRERTLSELRSAQLMQKSLLPSARLQKEIIAKSGLDIASRSASCTELGGDLWGLSDLDHGQFGVYTLDVAGHGTAAALNTFRLHALIHELGAWLLEPARFLQQLNMRLVELVQPGTFATMFYAVIDTKSNCITYAAAGSPPPLLCSGTDLPLISLDSTGVPLGISPDADYASFKADFGPGAIFFLYSDILTDFTDENGHRAGEAGAFAVIQSCIGDASAEVAVERVCAPFFDPDGLALSDDLTVVCIMRPHAPLCMLSDTDPLIGGSA